MRNRVTMLVSAFARGAAWLLPVALPRAAQSDPQDFTQVERSRYLATAADCTGCHTQPGRGKPFAGAARSRRRSAAS
jgi:cytochrome c553